MTRRMERHRHTVHLQPFAILQPRHRRLAPDSQTQHLHPFLRTQVCLASGPRVVAVRVSDERPIDPPRWINVKATSRAPQALMGYREHARQ